MRIVSFNVNGIRSIKEYYAVTKGWSFDQFLDSFQADIICFQETKLTEPSNLDHNIALPKDYVGYFAFQRGSKKIGGYSGVVTYCRRPSWLPVRYEEGFSGIGQVQPRQMIGPNDLLNEQCWAGDLCMLDSEGRCMITDHVHFILVHVYFPNDSGPERDDFRLKFYEAVWLRCLDFINAGRSVILLGDINVTYHPRDHCDFAKPYFQLCRQLGEESVERAIREYHSAIEGPPSENILLSTFYSPKPLRSWLYRLLHQQHKMCDLFRHFHPKEGEKYTCWSTLVSARGTNYGTRIDLILTAGPLFTNLSKVALECDIQPKVMGSDHCPVYGDFDLQPVEGTTTILPHVTKSFQIQRKLEDYFVKQIPSNTIIPPAPSRSAESKKRMGTKITDYFAPKKPKTEIKDDKLASLMQHDEQEADTLVQETASTVSSYDWRKLFHNPRPAPLCRGHYEPCKLLRVNKPGRNQGRHFYGCARPTGHPSDPDARCGHFEWLSDGKGDEKCSNRKLDAL